MKRLLTHILVGLHGYCAIRWNLASFDCSSTEFSEQAKQSSYFVWVKHITRDLDESTIICNIRRIGWPVARFDGTSRIIWNEPHTRLYTMLRKVLTGISCLNVMRNGQSIDIAHSAFRRAAAASGEWTTSILSIICCDTLTPPVFWSTGRFWFFIEREQS